MSLKAQKILNVNITIDSQEKVLEEIRKYLIPDARYQISDTRKKLKPLVIFTPNPEIINYAQKDFFFKQIVNSGQINIPDGWGVTWAIKKIYGLQVEKISGVDLMLDVCKLANENGLRIGLIGGRGGVSLTALECLQKMNPGLKGWAVEGPEIRMENARLPARQGKWKMPACRRGRENGMKEEEKIFKNSIEEKIDILFVGLGFPKQEYFIDRIQRLASSVQLEKPLVLMAVGGAFDYISGRVPRAPEFMRKRGLEWVHRLMVEPWRLPRQITGGEFFVRVLRGVL